MSLSYAAHQFIEKIHIARSSYGYVQAVCKGMCKDCIFSRRETTHGGSDIICIFLGNLEYQKDYDRDGCCALFLHRDRANELRKA